MLTPSEWYELTIVPCGMWLVPLEFESQHQKASAFGAGREFWTPQVFSLVWSFKNPFLVLKPIISFLDSFGKLRIVKKSVQLLWPKEGVTAKGISSQSWTFLTFRFFFQTASRIVVSTFSFLAKPVSAKRSFGKHLPPKPLEVVMSKCDPPILLSATTIFLISS